MKDDNSWKEQLTAEEFSVCRQKGTERPFTGEYWDYWETGKYNCTCCGEPLFDSDTKFDAGCGWPSFYQSSEDADIEEHFDDSLGMRRTEVTCKKCGSHLGHVFPDGPQPTGLRYCIKTPPFHGGNRGSTPLRDATFFKSLKSQLAGIAQLVERNLAKVEVAGSNPVSRCL